MIRVAGIVVALIGGSSVFGTLQNRRKAEEARTWHTADAAITRSEVVVTETGEERSVTPRIEYTDEAGGGALTGTTIGFATTDTESDASKYVRTYPAGSTVRLHYNPDAMNECCLETGADPRT